MKSFAFLYAVFEPRIETNGAVCIETVVSHLDAAWRHLSESRKFCCKLKVLPPIYLEITCGYPTT